MVSPCLRRINSSSKDTPLFSHPSFSSCAGSKYLLLVVKRVSYKNGNGTLSDQGGAERRGVAIILFASLLVFVLTASLAERPTEKKTRGLDYPIALRSA